MKTTLTALALTLTFLTTGCAAAFDGAARSHALPPATSPPRPNTRTFAKPFDATWRATMTMLVEHRDPIDLSQKDSGVITLRPRILYSGFGAGEYLRGLGYPPTCSSCDYSNAKETVSIFVVSSTPESTSVRVVSKLEGLTSTWGWKEFGSAGIRESAFLDSLATRL